MATPHSSEEEATTREAMEQQPFVDRHWLWHNGLRRETVLDYFAQSRFYDRASCNEELRMQGAIDVRAEHLKGMTGLQYLAEEVPGPTPDAPIFVIQKLLRASAEQEPQVLDVYYVLNGVIYQAPTIFSVLNARLRRCAHMLNTAQKTLRKAVGLHGFHQQAGQAGYPDISMAGSGGAADLYSLKRGRGGGRGSRGGRGGRGGKRAKQAAQQYQLQGYEASPMLLPPPPMHYGQGDGEYYPPLRGEEMVLMDMNNLPQHPSPQPSPHGGSMVPPPPPPAEGSNGQPPFPQSELPPRLISRYPGPSPLTDVMTRAHPDAAAAAEKVVSGVVEEAAARQGGGSTSSHSTAATAGMGPTEAAVGVSGREEI